jgi:hypothetical protein
VSTPYIWTPGHAGPLDELVARITSMVAAFAQEHRLDQAEVRLELHDGSRYLLAAAAPEPGFGFFSFVPHARQGEEPKRIVVPVGAVRLIEISAPDPERAFGFAVSA